MLKIISISIILHSFSIFLFSQDVINRNTGNSYSPIIDNTSPGIIKSGNGTSQEQREQINKALQKSRSALLEKGILDIEQEKDILFGFPLRLKNGLTDPGFYSISSYMDHDPDYPDHLQDFNCEELTYDLEDGYNHQGTDYYLWPFPWHKMQNNEVEVVAAAAGTILLKTDGNFDQNCDGEDLTWNAVFILHENGFITWYGHLKDGSLTDKFVGEEVAIGEYLGIVGSSGISITPHLHFEMHDESGNVIDPYSGPCNPDIEESLWIDQIPYLESGINHIATNKTTPAFPECPQAEILNEANTFSGKDTVFLMAYFRNFPHNEQLKISIIKPDETIWQEWVWSNPQEFHTASWNYWFILLKNQSDGFWTYRMEYEGNTYDHEFYYSNEASVIEKKALKLKIYPNPVSLTAEIKLPNLIFDNFRIEILDSYGKELTTPHYQFTNRESVILDCNDLVDGIYIIMIKTDGYIYQGKLIKQ